MGTAGMALRVLCKVTAMRRLRHPNVLRLHEVLAMRAKIYLVMELTTDGDLLSRLAALPWRRLPEHVARRVFVQLGARRGPAGSLTTPACPRTRRTSTAVGISSLLHLRTWSLPSPPCLSSLCGGMRTER
jgi:serine/threonine protein kinase